MAAKSKKTPAPCTEDACPIEWEPDTDETRDELSNGKGEDDGE